MPCASQKSVGGGGSSGGSGTVPKQRPTPASAPSAAPQPPPAKITKSPSFIQEEIEVAEVLFGLTRQFPAPSKQENSNHKPEPRDASEPKSGNSSPAPSSSAVRPSDSSSLIAAGGHLFNSEFSEIFVANFGFVGLMNFYCFCSAKEEATASPQVRHRKPSGEPSETGLGRTIF